MKRLLGVALVLMSLVAIVGSASASEWYMKLTPVHWSTSKDVTTTEQTFSDSISLSLSARTDTTQAISCADWAWEQPAGALSTTAMPLARVYITTPNVCTYTAADSAYFYVDGSVDGTNWIQVRNVEGQAIRGTTPKTVTFMITALPSGSDVISALYHRFIRLRINFPSAHTFTAARCYVYHPALRQAQ